MHYCNCQKSTKYKYPHKGFSKNNLEVYGDTLKFREGFIESATVNSTERGFKIVQHNVATFERTKKKLSCSQPKSFCRRKLNLQKKLTIAKCHSNTLCLLWILSGYHSKQLVHLSR